MYLPGTILTAFNPLVKNFFEKLFGENCKFNFSLLYLRLPHYTGAFYALDELALDSQEKYYHG